MKNKTPNTCISGKDIAAHMKESFRDFFSALPYAPTLHIVNFLDHAAIDSFVRIKRQFAQDIGVNSQYHRLVHVMDQDEGRRLLIEIIEALRPGDGLIIQLPLPAGWDYGEILSLIPVRADVDVLHPENYMHFKTGVQELMPPVAGAVKKVFESIPDLDISDCEIVVVGRGKLVGQPTYDWLISLGLHPNIIDVNTNKDQARELIKNAQIIISGAGDPWFITPDMISDHVILLDAGTSNDKGELKGDIHPDCYAKAQYYTPVPGGIGPLTVAMIFENLTKLQQK